MPLIFWVGAVGRLSTRMSDAKAGAHANTTSPIAMAFPAVAIYEPDWSSLSSNFMPIQWAGLSPELLLPVDRGRPEPLRSQLEAALREAIRSGRLGIGERLPSSRELARELGVSRGLVQECYGQLQAEGYLNTRIGSATRVAAAAHPAAPPLPPTPPSAPQRLIADFRAGVPDLASFPRGDWLWALREVAQAVPTAELDYGEARGSSTLRAVLAAYLRRVRGAAADQERMVVSTGFAQGLNLILRVLAADGVRRIAFEDPGYPDASPVAARWGLETIPVPVDESGIKIDALAATKAQAVVLIPAHQWPTGVVLSPERRLAVLEWADRHEATIIEDDYDAEFRYDREPVGVLQGLRPDRVAALGTVSKSLAPTIRLGWVLCPPTLADAIAEEKLSTDRGSPGLDQLVLAKLIESGRFDRHLRRMRAMYAQRRSVLVEALERHAPEVRLTGLAAGFHAVAHLPESVDESTIIAAARERSVGLYGMSTYRSTHATGPTQLVLGFGNLTERSIQAGIAAISDLLRGR